MGWRQPTTSGQLVLHAAPFTSLHKATKRNNPERQATYQDQAPVLRDCANMRPLTGFDDFLPDREAQ